MNVQYLNIKVIPKAQRTEIVGEMVGSDNEKILKVKVAAMPEKGKANKALCDFLAKEYGVSKSQVSVVQGHASQRKVVKIVSSKQLAVGS